MKQKINLKTLVILLFFCTTSQALTLDKAIKHAIKNSDLIKQQNSAISSYKASKISNFNQVFLPSVSLAYSKDNENDIINKTFDVSYQLSGLYKGSIGYKSGSEFLNYNTLTSDAIKNEVIIQAISVYLKIVEIKKSIDVYKQSLTLNQKMLKQVKKKVSKGSAVPSSAYLIEAETESIKALINLEKSKLETEEGRFYSITKLKPNKLTKPKPQTFEYKTLNSFVKNVEDQNMQIQAIKAKKASAKYEVGYETSKFLPDVTLSYQKYSNNTALLNQKNDGSKIVLSARFYLYKPGLIASVVQKGYEYRASKFELANEIETKVNKAKELWLLHQYYKENLASKKKIVKIRNMILKERMQNYNFGMLELTDTLNEEKNLRNAELELIKAQFSMLLNIYKMRDLAGKKLY